MSLTRPSSRRPRGSLGRPGTGPQPDTPTAVDGAGDAQLTRDGIALETTRSDGADGRLLLIACGALAREALAVLRANALEHVTLTCLPALLHNRPDSITDAVRQRIREGRAAGFRQIFVLYGDCGTGGALDRMLEVEGVERLPGAHCYAFYEGIETFAAHAETEIGAFYLTDFLARQFDALVWRGLGLDRHPDLREMYFGHYDRIVYLAQTDDPRLSEMADAAGRRLDLPVERRLTGYGALGIEIRRQATLSRPT
ncbi:MAG: DUF1638 domain-containing protein [Pseudomonadota bacterium]